jgi:glutathione S-transferase
MPVLHVGDDSVGQSAAINYYIAAENGLMGDSNLEAAQIINVSEHLKELMTAWRVLVPYGVEPSAEVLNTWFETGADDVTGTAVGAARSTRYAKWWMGRIEATLGNNGFAVGNKLSLADVLIYNTFAETLDESQALPDTPQWKRESFGSKAAVDAALANYPKLKASCDAVAANANVQKWLSTRGVQGF